MIAQERPKAVGRAAQHCAQLLSRAADPVDPVAEIARLAERFAAEAAGTLADLCDAKALRVEAQAAQLQDADSLFAAIGMHASNSFFALGMGRLGALASIANCEVNAQFERFLGGDGRVDRTNVRLPRSALPYAARMETRVLAALRAATQRDEFALAHSQGRAADIVPFAGADEVWVLVFLVTPPAGSPWTVTLALCCASLAQLVDTRAASPATGRALGEGGGARGAIGAVELPVSAILVDAAVPLSRLARLQPGAVLPIAVNRSIPLLVEHAVIAHGTPGEIDDRVALEITHTVLPGTH